MARSRAGGDVSSRPGCFTRLVGLTCWLYAAGVLGYLALLRGFGDSHWAGTMALFGPRWPAAAPLALLLPLALLVRRRWVLPLIALGAVVAIPIMGYTVPVKQLLGSDSPPARDLRFLTYNIGGGVTASALQQVIEEEQPDIAIFQEGDIDQTAVSLFPKYKVRSAHAMTVLSRFPIRKVESRDQREVWAEGGSGACDRYLVDGPRGPISVVSLHLETPREGVAAVMHERLAGVPELEKTNAQRWKESKFAREWVDATPGAPIIGGDFNMPMDSRIYQTYWADFTEAFAAGGNGFGWSKQTSWFGMRIDHILVGKSWVVDNCRIARHAGGDHRPVVADLRWLGK